MEKKEGMNMSDNWVRFPGPSLPEGNDKILRN
jgi:hypothetical protein